MHILSRHLIETRQINVAEDSKMECEMMAVIGKGPDGLPGIVQYRLQVQAEEEKEEWRG